MLYQVLNIILILLCVLYMETESMVKEKQRRISYFFLIVIAVVLFAFRPEETKDTFGYIQSFKNIESFSDVDITVFQKYQGYEIGYIYLMVFFNALTNSYRCFFLFVSFIGLTGSLYAMNQMSTGVNWIGDPKREKPLQGVVLALYISNYGFLYHGISVRAGLSFAFGLLFFINIQKGKNVYSILFIALAFLVQRISILFAVAYIMYRFFPVMRRWISVVIWLVLGFLLFSGIASSALHFIISWIMTIFNRYNITGYYSYLVSLDVAVGLTDIYKWLLYGLLIILCDDKSENQRYLNVVLMGAVIVVFMHDVRAVSRAYDIFYLFSIPLLSKLFTGELACYLKPVPFRRIIVYIVIIIGSLIQMRTCFG